MTNSMLIILSRIFPNIIVLGHKKWHCQTMQRLCLARPFLFKDYGITTTWVLELLLSFNSAIVFVVSITALQV